ncbi:MAG TPA: iron-sulfur cluster assembly scaffold protein [Gemmatimonadaceae bacterium]|nr:iron-sulfur cluster assembly scaffold protein [Gemmatimonadaceae bacterium]
MTAFRAIVLEHFKHPRNRGPLPDATVSVEGANPLCGDRIRVELLVDDDTIADARFTADACAICIAAASTLTEHARGMGISRARAIDVQWLHRALEGEPPPARMRCVTLPLDTLHRALSEVA